MKNKIWGICGAVISALFLCPNAHGAAGGQLIYDGYVPIPAVDAYSSTFSIRADGIDWASIQILTSSVTTPSQTFTDGQTATATLTVNTYTALSSAAATGSITVNNLGYLGSNSSCVSGGGYGLGNFNVCTPGNFVVTTSTGVTACNLAAAINSFSVVVATCTGASSSGVVYTTAPYGAQWNSFALNTTSNTTGGALLASGAFLTGGQNNNGFSINGVQFAANAATNGFTAVTSNNQTATNIASAINTAAIGVTGSATTNVVTVTANLVGPSGDYAVTSSSNNALSVLVLVSSNPITGASVGVMSGGQNASYLINTSTIALSPGTNFGNGQALLFPVSNVALGGLTTGTTYYVISNTALGTGNIELATSQANALAGTAVVLTSSATKSTADTYTLTSPAITGTTGVSVAASNDNTHWIWYNLTPFNVAVGSNTYASYTAGGQASTFDLGHFDYSYLGVSVVAPTAGAINVQAHIIGNAP